MFFGQSPKNIPTEPHYPSNSHTALNSYINKYRALPGVGRCLRFLACADRQTGNHAAESA
jgi:hypothetical protein